MQEQTPRSPEKAEFQIEGYNPKEHQLIIAGKTIYVLNRDLTCVAVVDRASLKPSLEKQHIIGEKAIVVEQVAHEKIEIPGPPVPGAQIHFDFPENPTHNLTSGSIVSIVEPKSTKTK